MNRRCALGLCAIALVTIPAFPNSSVAQGKSLRDQLVGTWIYVSSTAKRDNGSAVQRPSLKGAATYTADGRFQLIATRTDAPKYTSGDPARPSSDEAMAIPQDRSPTPGRIRWTKTQRRSTLTSRQARFQISSEPLICAGSSSPLPPTKCSSRNLDTPAGVTMEYRVEAGKVTSPTRVLLLANSRPSVCRSSQGGSARMLKIGAVPFKSARGTH